MMSDQGETEALSETTTSRMGRRGRPPGERGRPRGKNGGKAAGKSRVNESTGSERHLTSYTADDGTEYHIGDCVYVDSQRADAPHLICSVREFRVSKRCNVHVAVGWFFRPSEVPESVYDHLVQDRGVERGPENVFENVNVIQRELFMSDTYEVYPAKLLRGKCYVKDAKTNVENLEEYTKQNDTFFYFFAYNPETRRLNSTQGEIRIGPSHQTALPECRDHKPLESEDSDHPPEQLVWSGSSKIEDKDLRMYLTASRSLTHYNGWCKTNGDIEEACQMATGDRVTQAALDTLHGSLYNHGSALGEMLRCPLPLSGSKNWDDAEVKLFVKGLRQYGKNFYRIKKALFPEKQTGELVEFYYHWKKSPSALSTRPHKRYRRQAVMRRTRAVTRASKATQQNEFVSLSSASESDFDSDDSGERDLSGYACHHCYTLTSKDWHHAGFDKVLLCTDCRLYFKKYGEMRKVKVPKVPPICLLKTEESRSRRRKDHENGFGEDGDSKTHSANNRRITRLQKRKLNGSPTAAVSRKRPGKRTAQPKSKRRRRRKACSSASSDTADLGDVESDEAGNRSPHSGSDDESGSSGDIENGSSFTSVADEDEDRAMHPRGRTRQSRHGGRKEDGTKPRTMREDVFPRVTGQDQNGPGNSQPQVEDWTQSPSVWASHHGVPRLFYSGFPPGLQIPPQQEVPILFQPYIHPGLAGVPNLEEITRMQMAACPQTEMGLTEELFCHQLQQQMAALQAIGYVFPSPFHPLVGHPLASPVAFHPPAEHLCTDVPMLLRQQAAAIRQDPVQLHNMVLLEQALVERTGQWQMNHLLAQTCQPLDQLQHFRAERDRYAQHEMYERVRQELLLHDQHYQQMAADAMLNGLAPNLSSGSVSRQRVHANPS